MSPPDEPLEPDPLEWRCGEYTISTDLRRFDIDVFHAFVSTSSWAMGRSREMTNVVVQNSLVFGLHSPDHTMVGAARVVTDFATFGWVSDVFVLPSHRGQGLASCLVAAICDHPKLRGMKRMMLVTDDTHGLYARHGFTELATPERLMERRPDS